MDIEFELQGIRFVANRDKARRNPAKHQGVTFEQAAQAFFDPFLRVVDADRNEEARDAVIGMDAASRLLFVVHIQQEDDRIRLVSARKATREERNLYENG
ncbi:MAG: BrnT family toxin [Rhodocyclales bacterium]|nr:BrnT family toxin [Rhodocyclales bacterium]